MPPVLQCALMPRGDRPPAPEPALITIPNVRRIADRERHPSLERGRLRNRTGQLERLELSGRPLSRVGLDQKSGNRVPLDGAQLVLRRVVGDFGQLFRAGWRDRAWHSSRGRSAAGFLARASHRRTHAIRGAADVARLDSHGGGLADFSDHEGDLDDRWSDPGGADPALAPASRWSVRALQCRAIDAATSVIPPRWSTSVGVDPILAAAQHHVDDCMIGTACRGCVVAGVPAMRRTDERFSRAGISSARSMDNQEQRLVPAVAVAALGDDRWIVRLMRIDADLDAGIAYFVLDPPECLAARAARPIPMTHECARPRCGARPVASRAQRASRPMAAHVAPRREIAGLHRWIRNVPIGTSLSVCSAGIVLRPVSYAREAPSPVMIGCGAPAPCPPSVTQRERPVLVPQELQAYWSAIGTLCWNWKAAMQCPRNTGLVPCVL